MGLELREGAELPVLRKLVTQEQINLYAEASGDSNPIHLDEEFARKTSLGGRVAHGMLALAYISEMMVSAFGKAWLSGGRLDVRFKTAARPGDTVTASGKITMLDKSGVGTAIVCSVLCADDKGKTIITGEASLILP